VIRVALVSAYYPAHRGGVEAVAGELAKRIAASGAADITWHASDCDPPPPDSPGLKCVPARSWNVAERRAGFPYPVWSPAALRALARSVRRSDVVHLHDCVYLPSIVAFLTALSYRRPVLVTQHIGAVPYRNPLLRALSGAASRTLGALVLGRAARTVFVSEQVRAYFSRFVRFRAAPLYIPNGVDTSAFVPLAASSRGAEDPLLLFVGRFVERKGLALLKEVAAALPRIRWVLAGWGRIDPEAWGLPQVSVLRGVRKEQLVPLYQAADLLVLPSVGEGFPLVVQEAMACGTPALIGKETAAGCPAAGDLLLTESLGAPDDPARWRRRIESLLAAPALLTALRPRVAAFAAQHWSWDRCAEGYAALLRDCVIEKQISSRLGKHSADRPER
jgi:phosphatidyl-myo-inositol dimannoside synthase